MPDRLLKVPEARDRLGHISQESIYKLLNSGELPSVKLGPKSRRIRESDLDQFIANLPGDRPGDAA
jgi:excisionase family DNA binding protein